MDRANNINRIKIKNKLYCILWLIGHGFVPQKDYWIKKLKLLKTTHTYFNSRKFELCGKICISAFKPSWKKETWEINGIWDFPDGLVKRSYKWTKQALQIV